MFFFFNDTATTEIYTLSLHDALPISRAPARGAAERLAEPARVAGAEEGALVAREVGGGERLAAVRAEPAHEPRSEEHTSELQSRQYLVCRLLLEKKKKIYRSNMYKRY